MSIVMLRSTTPTYSNFHVSFVYIATRNCCSYRPIHTYSHNCIYKPVLIKMVYSLYCLRIRWELETGAGGGVALYIGIDNGDC